MDENNTAIVADKRNVCSVENLPIPVLDENEVLVKVIYTGMNASDLQHPKFLGVRDTVLGFDFCGQVINTHSPKFEINDIVAGYTPVTVPRPAKYGTYQAYLCCPDSMCYKVPYNLPKEDAAALTVVAMTAADAIFNLFKLPLPTDTEKRSTGPLLIWGASTSVGLCAVQFARASSQDIIIATASPERHKLLYLLGATHCFDYSSPTVLQDIKNVISESNKGPLAYGFDAIGTKSTPSSADLVRQCASSETVLVSVMPQFHRKFKLPVAVSHIPVNIKPFGLPIKITTPTRPNDHWRAWSAVSWAVQNYGYGGVFYLPKITIFQGTGEEALEKAKAIADGKEGFGKTVIQQPFL